jgi:hypothetical protein
MGCASSYIHQFVWFNRVFRRRILLAFERAETEPDPGERRRLLNFGVVID